MCQRSVSVSTPAYTTGNMVIGNGHYLPKDMLSFSFYSDSLLREITIFIVDGAVTMI